MSIELTELLINEVKKYPELYDSSCVAYKDTFGRAKIYNKIAKAIGGDFTGKICKQKWKNLRDTYVKHLRGSIPQNKVWTWSEEMKFFEPYLHKFRKSHFRRKKVVEDYSDSENGEDHEMEAIDDKYKEENDSLTAVLANTSVRPDPLQEDIIFHPTANMSMLNFDDTDLIFLGYARTVKKLKMTRQIQTKFEIAKLLMNAEMQDLAEKDFVKRDVS